MNYEQKYKEALEKLQEALAPCEDGCKISGLTRDCLENIFPELAESKDERIRREIVAYINELAGLKNEKIPTEWLAWLEKQGKKLDAELCQSEVTKTSGQELEPKFHPGDWIVDDETPNDVFCVIEVLGEIYKVIDINGDDYHIPHCKADNQFHLWTIHDAKNGDVLHSTGFHNDCIFIFNGLDNWRFDEPNGDRAVATGYCCLSVSADKMEFGIQGPDCVEVNTIKPATKIQRGLLFQKMEEAGYEWDADKKELKKMEVASKENAALPDVPVDERIRNSIALVLTDVDEQVLINRGVTLKAVLDWLERQGKNVQPDIPEDGQILNSLTDVDKRAFLDRPVTLRAAIDWLEKQGEKMVNADKVIAWLNHRELSYDDMVTNVIPDDSPTSIPPQSEVVE